jgi:transitional endoplasmic reticulum ATPase
MQTNTRIRSKTLSLKLLSAHWAVIFSAQGLLLITVYIASNYFHSSGVLALLVFAFIFQFLALAENMRRQNGVSYFVFLGTVCLFFWIAFLNCSSTTLTLLAVAIAALLAFGLFSNMKIAEFLPKRFNAAASGLGTAGDEFTFSAKSVRRTLDSIYGMDDFKARLKSAVEIIIGSKDSPVEKNGILLFGGPGNGKTGIANALAGEFGLSIITISSGDIASKWIGETTTNLKKVFADAQAQAPCILFFDEADSIIGNRADSKSNNTERRDIVNTMLTECVNLRGKGIVLVAATNHLDQLDAAAIREGRFDFKLEVTAPDQLAREGLLRSTLDKFSLLSRTKPGVIESASRRWEGFSAKRIIAVVEELVEITSAKNYPELDLANFQSALRQIQGRKGNVPESTLGISDLVLDVALRRKVDGLALRMKNIEAIEASGGTVPSGVLFFGEPGTGKTELARSLAKETGWGFLYTTGSDLLNSPGAIDRLVEEAKDIRPAIVFIDEADDILQNRTTSLYRSGTPITNKILTIMDGAGGKCPDIVFMAATNHPERIDPAAMRSGRFTEKVHCTKPNREGRVEFVSRWLAHSKANFDSLMTPIAIADLIGEATIPTINAILQEAVNSMLTRTLGSTSRAIVEEADIRAAQTII